MARGWTRNQLAEKSKGGPYFLTATTIKRAERGDAIYASTAGSLAMLLEVPLTELLVDGMDGAARLALHPMVAVLPFRSVGDESASFAEGLADDLITRLSRWWFPVVARTSTLGPNTVDSGRVMRDLGAKYWIGGSVRRAGNTIRITAELVDAESNRIVASHPYDGSLEEVFKSQNDLIAAILADLSPRLLDVEAGRLQRRDPKDLEAWQQGLLGAWHFYRRTAEDNTEARRLLEAALAKDRCIPLGWYVLALTHQQDMVNQWCSNRAQSMAGLNEVCAAFERLYPEEARSHVVSAYRDVYEGKRDSAMRRLTAAIELDPNTCSAYGLYGQTLSMAREPDRGLEQFEIALRLSPKDSERWTIYTGIALAHFTAEHYEETVIAATEASRIRSTVPFPYGTIASAHGLLGNLPEAREALNTMFKVAPNTTVEGLVSIMGSTDPDIGERYLEGLRRAGMPS